MSNDEYDRNSNSIIVNANGDVIGVNTKGDKNIVGKDIHVSQTSTNIKQINIDQQILSRLDTEYAKAFTQITESLNNKFEELKNITSEQVAEIQKNLEVLAKETEGMNPNQQPLEEKRRNWKEKFKIFAKHAIKALPKTASTLALFHPLTAPFSKNIEEGLQNLVEGMQEAM